MAAGFHEPLLLNQEVEAVSKDAAIGITLSISGLRHIVRHFSAV